ncbi:unnamed protein product [Pleuronectes platessa]|uniref:Uncharacterized protein n=1 Tax=Pleuronectes platessa TaxID=8262 RepID=A0A9N7U214_PLEPL|nr:unnamed protein product [Pleuronectes platessa]
MALADESQPRAIRRAISAMPTCSPEKAVLSHSPLYTLMLTMHVAPIVVCLPTTVTDVKIKFDSTNTQAPGLRPLSFAQRHTVRSDIVLVKQPVSDKDTVIKNQVEKKVR